MEIQQVALTSIVPYDRNAKKHPPEQIDKIARSIREFGFNQPIVTDMQGVIIAGHGRYQAAQALQMETVPVLRVDISPEKAQMYRLADNKLNESAWDFDTLVPELKELDGKGLDISITGFTLADMNLKLNAQDPNLGDQGFGDSGGGGSENGGACLKECPECGWKP